MRPTPLLAWTASVAVAALAGALLSPAREARPARTAATTCAATPAAAPAPRIWSTAGLTGGEVRAILREELAAQLGGTDDAADDEAADPSTDSAAAEAPTPEARQAAGRARAVVTAAIDRGSWTAADRDAFRVELGRMSRSDFEALVHELLPAINQGRVQIAYNGLPF